ncbi:GntR family transcriptional regulator [Streptomyces nitrosporeus]|uniref:GntR family transcriptional regulator n=1 Tax=Streptomyces nitrosporeus TaxID=28894 RepID=UPI0039A2DF8F
MARRPRTPLGRAGRFAVCACASTGPQHVFEDIESGTLAVDRPIPSESALIQRWGVARETARCAVRHLRELGYVCTVPQRGTYVCDRGEDERQDAQ